MAWRIKLPLTSLTHITETLLDPFDPRHSESSVKKTENKTTSIDLVLFAE